MRARSDRMDANVMRYVAWLNRTNLLMRSTPLVRELQRYGTRENAFRDDVTSATE